MADMHSNDTGTLFISNLNLKFENICPGLYYSGLKFDVNLENTLLLLLILKIIRQLPFALFI